MQKIMVYCQRCGRKIAETRMHCPYCGILQER
ncbi:MAG: zinc-ribbon domain-containing protein, partial [Ligilactobacillus sp.]|nr:zinc-ribbon domain-containing protein [Ligilactobacillus sp.]